MQSQTQRSRHGEPVTRLPLSVRCGRRHTRRREVELVSIACSTLQIRRRRVHVPRSIFSISEGMESVGGTPMSDDELDKHAPSLRSVACLRVIASRSAVWKALYESSRVRRASGVMARAVLASVFLGRVATS